MASPGPLRCSAAGGGSKHKIFFAIAIMEQAQFHATTILVVRRQGKVAMGGDGQVSLGNTVMKHKANKVRRMYHDKVIGGFAGATADAFALFARFEEKLEKFQGNLARSAVELAKDWRTDKMLRRLEAMLIVADKENSFLISGTGDVSKSGTGTVILSGANTYSGGTSISNGERGISARAKRRRGIERSSTKCQRACCIAQVVIG